MFIGYIYCNIAYYVCLVNEFVVIMCFFDFDFDFCSVLISYILVYFCFWGERCFIRSYWIVIKG